MHACVQTGICIAYLYFNIHTQVQAHNGKLQLFGKLETPFRYSVFHHKSGPGVQLDTPYLNPEV